MSDTAPIFDRIAKETKFFRRRAILNRYTYWCLKGVQLITATVMPLAVPHARPAEIAGLVGTILGAIETVQQMGNFHERWLTYERGYEALVKEKSYWENQVGPYRTEGNELNATLCDRVENIIGQTETDKIAVDKTGTEVEDKKKSSTTKSPQVIDGDFSNSKAKL
jgi:hypothetical protein